MLTLAQLPALKTEIALPAYSGLDEPATADTLNAKTVAADVDVAIETIVRRLIGQGILGKVDARLDVLQIQIQSVMQRAADLAVSAGAAATAVAALNVAATEARLAALHNSRRSLEMLTSYQMSDSATKAFVTAMLNALVTEGVLSDGERTGLLALAAGNISRAEQLFGRGTVVDSGDVSRAKKV
jgi:hypothetical protein